MQQVPPGPPCVPGRSSAVAVEPTTLHNYKQLTAMRFNLDHGIREVAKVSQGLEGIASNTDSASEVESVADGAAALSGAAAPVLRQARMLW